MESQTPYQGVQTQSDSGLAQQAKDKLSDTADKVSDTASSVKESAGEAVRDQVDQRSTQVGEQISSTADDVRAVGDTLRDRGNDTAARIADQAAQYAQRAADYLRGSSPDRILSDVEDFARKQPWVVVAGGLVVGFAASRVLRASRRRTQSDSWSGRSDYYSGSQFAGDGYSQAGYGQGGYTDAGYSGAGYSQTGYAQGGYTQTGYSGTDYGTSGSTAAAWPTGGAATDETLATGIGTATTPQAEMPMHPADRMGEEAPPEVVRGANDQY